MDKEKKEYKLINEVLKRSSAPIWGEAAQEWDVVSEYEDEDCETKCVCGKEGIRYCFVIRNRITGAVLEPIGSECIKKFGNAAMVSKMKSLHKFCVFLTEFNHYYKTSGRYGKFEYDDRCKFVNLLKDGDVLYYLNRDGILGDKDYNFLWDIRRKRNLSRRQSDWRNDITKKTILALNFRVESRLRTF